VTSQTIRSK